MPTHAGEIRWNGEVVTAPAAFFVPPRAACTPQVPRLFSASLRENILLGLPESSVDLAGAVRKAVLERNEELRRLWQEQPVSSYSLTQRDAAEGRP